MSLSRRQVRTLRGIELDLAASDPSLNEFFVSFNLRPGGREMPLVERVARWPFRLGSNRSVADRVRHWCAENWNDP